MGRERQGARAWALVGASLLMLAGCGAAKAGNHPGATSEEDGGSQVGPDGGPIDNSGDGSSSGMHGGDGGTPSMACPATLSPGFAAQPASFTLPAERCQTQFDALAGDGKVVYDTMDLTGAGHPSLVVFSDDCDSTVGSTHWDVYGSSSSGFAAQPTAFAVPPGRCKTTFNASASDYGVTFSMLDLTADASPDLVVFSDSCDSTVGTTHWDVYPSSSAGFAQQPTPFAVPPGRCQTTFDASAGSYDVTFSTLDLTGDGHSDLVVFSDSCDSTVGTTHWDVYPWSSSGFAAQPTAFAVPPGRCMTTFDASAGSYDVTFSTLNLTGDGHSNLVVFSDNCDATVGATHWDVYPWSSSGFAAQPTAFAVPPGRCKTTFDAAAGSYDVTFSLLDLTGDSHSDLVVFSDNCDATVGSTHWDVYPWSSAGFAQQPTSFAVPPGRCKTTFSSAASDYSVTYDVTNLTGACGPSLVVSSDTCDTSVGQSHWDFYAQQ